LKQKIPSSLSVDINNGDLETHNALQVWITTQITESGEKLSTRAGHIIMSSHSLSQEDTTAQDGQVSLVLFSTLYMTVKCFE